jgi:hypothetical protein
MFPFPSPLLLGQGSTATIDGTQGSTNAGILAAVYFTVSGTTVTVVGQKNVASVTRLATGKYRITFSSALANNNYGMVCGGRWADSTGNNTPLITASRNTTGSINTYSTAAADIVACQGDGSIFDIAQCGVIFFDPSAVGSDYLAACSVTVSGTTPTVQRQTNVASAPRQSTGLYLANFTSALPDADYSIFGSSRYPDSTNDASPFFGPDRNTSRATGSINLDVGTLAKPTTPIGLFEPGRFSMLARNSDTSPRGTLAGARFSVSGGACTLIKSWNVASIAYNAAGLFTVNFTTPLVDTDYVIFGCAKWAASAGLTDTVIIGPNRNSTTGANVKSVSSLSLVSQSWGAGTPFDPETGEIWVVKPWLM